MTQSPVQGPRKICFCYANLDFLKVASNTSFLDVNFLYVGFDNLSFDCIHETQLAASLCEL